MNAVDVFKSALKQFPPIKGLIDERDALIKAHGIAPPGHFYSPVVSLAEMTRDKARLFGAVPRTIAGIDLNESEQLELMTEFETYYNAIPFTATKTAGTRYYYDNPAYSFLDAIILHCMMRHARPKRFIEIGSGFSSCAMLDTNEQVFSNAIQTTFIEPYPKLLESLITADDKARVTIVPTRLQDVDPAVFDQLQENDILFVDSTHESKTGSGVNTLFFDVMPRLNAGVFIHIHDVFYPFEYPEDWVFGGRSWNEIYMLRTFLQHNDKYKIVFVNTFMEHFHETRFQQTMPLCLKNRGGSIWLRKR